ncbi:MAG TPA: hypothetical protein VG033_05900 [Candidatus Acidoferrales bacterium]|jgi:hypothetical protein|nr:hypothetical protein [Candidatus Acidoferrales bacterium]
MQDVLKKLVDELKGAAGANLKSVVLYGSKVSGEFHARHSDVNILCVIESGGATALAELRPAVAWWMRQGHSAPLVFTEEELHRAADIFAIELLDIKAHHRVLFGEDLFAHLDVPMTLHRAQVERELRTNALRLRQAILTTSNGEDHLRLMTSSISSFAALFRHALLALGEKPPEDKRSAIQRMAALVGADAEPFETVLAVREGKLRESQMDVSATLRGYLALVERVTDEVDRRLAHS